MRICGIICEFNPFHNGHKHLLDRAREISGCDYLICVMSGSFTQRGEMCILDKYTRAKHAILGGADCVIELPSAFSTAPAEIFAKGAIKILSAIPDFCALTFGCETADKIILTDAAKILIEEPPPFKEILTKNIKEGQSYIKSINAAFEGVGGHHDLLDKPNNILAIEYCKAIFKLNKNIEIFPINRLGSAFNSKDMENNFSSSSAIRENLSDERIIANVPDYVYKDLQDFKPQTELFKTISRIVLSRAPREDLKKVYGCSEGLENAIKSDESNSFDEIVENMTSKRYPASRITRILCANFLRIYSSDCESYLKSDLYLKPLAVKQSCINKIMSQLSGSQYPVITSGSDMLKLNKVAKNCKELDDFAFEQRSIITGKRTPDKLLII